MAEPNPSGQPGRLGKVADAWDRIPVKGPMAGLVVVLGSALALTTGHNGGTCDTNPLRHIYRPQRLTVVQKCVRVSGTVVAWRHEHDGDYHVAMKMDGKGWVNSVNTKKQHGFTVVEFIPLDPRPKFKAGQRLVMLGTKVLDKQHGGWVELHPVFEVKVEETLPVVIQPTNKPALAPPTEEETP